MSEIYSTVFIWWITQFANVITDPSASITSQLSFPRHVHLPKNSGSNKCDWKSRSVMEECRGDPKSYERIYSPPPLTLSSSFTSSSYSIPPLTFAVLSISFLSVLIYAFHLLEALCGSSSCLFDIVVTAFSRFTVVGSCFSWFLAR